MAMYGLGVVRKAAPVLAGEQFHGSRCPDQRKTASPAELQRVVKRAVKAPLGAGRLLALAAQ